MSTHPHSPAVPKERDTRIIDSSGNVFVDLGFDPAEAEVLKLRTEVMIRTAEQLKARGWTQAEAARLAAGQRESGRFQPGHAADSGNARWTEDGTAPDGVKPFQYRRSG